MNDHVLSIPQWMTLASKSINIAHQDSPDLKIIIINNYNIHAHTLQTITCKNYTKISHCGKFEYIIKSTIIQQHAKSSPSMANSIFFINLFILVSFSWSRFVVVCSCKLCSCTTTEILECHGIIFLHLPTHFSQMWPERGNG